MSGKTAHTPRIVFGAETEYGIFFTEEESNEPSDGLRQGFIIQTMLDAVDTLSDAIVDSGGDSILDARMHTKVEKSFNLTAHRELLHKYTPSSLRGMRQRRGFSGLFLLNGARFYQDMGHPEWSIPEVDNPMDGVLYQRIGDSVVNACRKIAEEDIRKKLGRAVFIRIDKNNSDGKGSSYAAHENYALVPKIFKRICRDRKGKVDFLTEIVIAFFVARQIITGSGKVGSEAGSSVPFQISQRADFITRVSNLGTTGDRGIINLRDSPYADPDIVRRFHVIVGDGNMSDISLYLKFGTAALFFMMMNEGFFDKEDSFLSVGLKDPVRAYHIVSRDLTLSHKLFFNDGKKKTALQVMQEIAVHMSQFVREKNLDADWQRVVTVLISTLEGLSENRHSHEFARSLDWVIKERILHSHQRRTGVDPLDPTCQLLALEYHNINPEEGLFHKLRQRGDILEMISDEKIIHMQDVPPQTTRAWLRSEIIRRYGCFVRTMNWNTVCFSNDIVLRIQTPYFGSKEDAGSLFSGDPPLEEFFSRAFHVGVDKLLITA